MQLSLCPRRSWRSLTPYSASQQIPRVITSHRPEVTLAPNLSAPSILCRERKAQSGAVLGFPAIDQDHAEYEQSVRYRLFRLAISHLDVCIAKEISVFDGHVRGIAQAKGAQ